MLFIIGAEYKIYTVTNKSSNIPKFIPITCHYDNSTLLTKNGELVQIFKVTGFARKNISCNENIKDTIVSILNKMLKQHIMFYVYVVRDYESLDTTLKYECEFARIIHNAWSSKNYLHDCLINTLYIAVVHSGARGFFSTMSSSKIFFSTFKNTLFQKLDMALEEISTLSIAILEKLENYGPSLLSVVEKNDVLISEPLSFIHYLTHLNHKDIQIVQADFAHVLSTDLLLKSTFNCMQITTINNVHVSYDGDILIMKPNDSNISNSYSAIFSLKYQYDLDRCCTDKILTLNHRMIITETVKMVEKNKIIKLLSERQKIYAASNLDESLELMTGLIHEINHNKCSKNQITICIFDDTEQQLNMCLKAANSVFRGIGISLIREDLYMKGAYLSRIPGNSNLLRRENYTVPIKSGLFTSIHPKTMGNYTGSIWGEPIMIFRTSTRLPYHFNFHNKDNLGHTIIVGQPLNNPHFLKCLLICESLKFDLQLINCDYDGTDDNMIVLLDGDIEYYDAGKINSGNISFDIIQAFGRSVELLTDLLIKTLFVNVEFTDEEKAAFICVIKSVIAQYDLIQDDQKQDMNIFFKQIHSVINNTSNKLNSNIKYILVEFFAPNCFGQLFLKDNIKTIFSKKIQSLNLKNIFTQKNTKLDSFYQDNIKSLFVLMLLQQINKMLDVSNTIPIILSIPHQAMLFGFKAIYEQFMQLLDELSQKHVIILVTCNDKASLCNVENIEQLLSRIPTRFFLSDKFIDKNFKKIFALESSDVNIIKTYSPLEYMFLLKQDEQTIVASFDIMRDIKLPAKR